MYLAECLQKTGELNQAIKVCQKHLLGTPLDAKAKQLCATILYELGQLDEAELILTEIDIESQNKQFFVQVNQGCILYQKRQFENSLLCFQQAT